MGNRKAIEFMAEAAYDKIYDRAVDMAREQPGFRHLSRMEQTCLEAGIAAGVTAAIRTFGEAGLFK